MRKVLLLLIGTAVLWVPAVSMAGDSSSSPSRPAAHRETSRAERALSSPASTCKSKGRGARANAFGKCVSAIARQHEDDGDDRAGATKGQSDDSGERHSGDGAESQDRDSVDGHGRGSANPAMTCKAMQANDLAHFRSAYGPRPNAFGKCVSGHANGKEG